MCCSRLTLMTFCLLCLVTGRLGNDKMKRDQYDDDSSESPLSKFFREPQLGTSWYNPGGPTPTFQADQRNGTVYEVRLGDDAVLDCQVTAVERDLVSWFRVDGDFPVILTVGFKPHSADGRAILDFESPYNYRLRLSRVTWEDEGLYMCQLTVHPPSIVWARLRLIRPVVHLLDGDSNPVMELHYDVGTTIEMVCRVRRPPLSHATVLWEVSPAHKRHLRITDDNNNTSVVSNVIVLNRDVSRGGIKIDTGRNISTGNLISRLSLSGARGSDAGNYSCRLDPSPGKGHGLVDTIVVHVLNGENTEAIHSGAPTTGGDFNGLSLLRTCLVIIVFAFHSSSRLLQSFHPRAYL